MKLISRLDRLLAMLKEYREWVRLAEVQTGKGLLTQAREILALKQYGGHCGISDYYWYKLYDDSYHLGRGAPDFVGWRLQQQFSLALNPRMAVLPAWDKAVFTQLASSAGMPVAPVSAFYHASNKIADSLGVHLRAKADVANYLRNSASYPIFTKPAYSQQGYGSAYLIGYDPESDVVKQLNGATTSIEDFLHRLDRSVDSRYHKPECGFIFQECLKPANEIVALTNWDAICCVRVICLNGSDGVKPIRAFWKIVVPPNQVDNFSMGKYGNLLADVDLKSGKVGRVLGRFWPKAELLTMHPTSGQLFDGFKLPDWDKVLEACRLGGMIFPLMKIQHWDFALTDRGPLILELNDIGSTEAAQIHGRGLFTEESREFFKQYANTRAYPWVKAL